MTGFLQGLWLVVTLDLRQRTRTLAWYVLLAVFVVLVLAVTVLLVFATDAFFDGGGGVFSTIVFFVLLLGTLVSPALSASAINGERDAGTLATTQVTLVGTAQIVLGKWLAAWITGLAFLVAALPFLVFAVALGEVPASTIVVSTLVTALELGVVAAIGVGLSGVLTRPLFSVAVTYLVVAALSIGTLIAFGLGGASVRSEARTTNTYVDWAAVERDGVPPGEEPPCLPSETYSYQVPRFDFVWGFLAANPYVVVADAAPGSFDEHGNPNDLFGWIATGVRQAQHAPELEVEYDECANWTPSGSIAPDDDWERPAEVYDRSVPSWFVGLAVHVLLAAGALAWAIRRTRTPAQRLARGSRIA
ncbi:MULTISPECIES: ABC transporter permease [unclassified Agromyces]|uniref:ABC transporter permease n=1 Tax=unclassified Agromyces TaxID=2639701 RepID=UPI003014B09E